MHLAPLSVTDTVVFATPKKKKRAHFGILPLGDKMHKNYL
jgi:hypothetical protein